ncbi:MAG: histidine phosphatase family protein [Pseudonocardia sp.]
MGPARRVTFLTPAPTAATARAAFPADEPLDDRGRAWARAGRGGPGRADHAQRGPERACVETAAALGLDPIADHGLADWDLGRWAGRTLDDVATEHLDDVRAWLSDPLAAPHGGESLTALLARTQGWLATRPPGHTLAVCGTAVVRAAVVSVLDAPAAAFWRLDVGPMTRTDLRGGPDRWTVRVTGAELRGAAGR